jgi:hypothetical protein
MSGIEDLTPTDRTMLIDAIAHREGTAKQLSELYGVSIEELHDFVERNRPLITGIALQAQAPAESPGEPSPTQLDDLWISKKFERLKRYQEACDLLFKDIKRNHLSGSDLSTALREFRSYSMAAANELGQLLHRGAGDVGDGDVLALDVQGFDMNNLK